MAKGKKDDTQPKLDDLISLEEASKLSASPTNPWATYQVAPTKKSL